jgi:hypothetical protein
LASVIRDSQRSGQPATLSINQAPKNLHHAAPTEINDDLKVLHAPATFYRTKAPQKAIVAVAHPS